LLSTGDLSMIAVGFVVAFVSAFFTIRAQLRYVAHHDFVPFAWYRIAFGLVILGTAYAGLVRWD
jgi:undecaprenyl-diphosphatase